MGAAIGFGAVMAVTCSGCHWDPAWFPFAVAGPWGGMGVGVGIGIDALVTGEQVVYSRRTPLTPTVRVAPLLDRDRQGAVVSLGF